MASILELGFKKERVKSFDVYNVEIRIDGEKIISRNVDFLALHLSILAEDTSYHYIYTCSCGEPGCAGVWDDIAVSKDSDEVVWRFDKQLYEHLIKDEVKEKLETDLDDYVIRFNKRQYKEEIERLLLKMKEERALNKVVAVFSIWGDGPEDDIIHYDLWIKEALENEYFYKDEDIENEDNDYE